MQSSAVSESQKRPRRRRPNDEPEPEQVKVEESDIEEQVGRKRAITYQVSCWISVAGIFVRTIFCN